MSSSWNVDAYRSVSLSECHWKLCREFMTRYRHLYPEEQTVALAQIFANAQLLLRGDADQTTRLVLDLAREQPSAEVKLEVDGIEKGLVKREVVSSEDVPEVAVDSVVVKTEQINESEKDDNAELSSTHEDSTVESSTIGPPSAKQRKTDQKNPKRTPQPQSWPSKKPSHLPENQIARTEDPTTNSKHYKSIMKRFVKDSIEHELVFSEEFSEAERDKLQRIATKLDLETCIVESSTNPQLKVIGQPLPALAIVERIVVQKDPELGALYEAIAPSVGARVDVST
ncbi:hypothetical protein pipiens_016983 [Culex pipiens pipiens]|uniref:XRN2-binding (XTBD) domain-containing protein n=1 Tax=Culex pipiens pipiens TaxID=38569 RepID=A0ABD1CK21_CULPP